MNNYPYAKIISEQKISFARIDLGKNWRYLITILSLSLTSLFLIVLQHLMFQPQPIQVEDIIASQQPTTTGAILSNITEEQKAIDSVNSDLFESLPLTTSSFTINYSFKDNAYLIKPTNNQTTYQQDFLDWINNSPYQVLPSSYFKFK